MQRVLLVWSMSVSLVLAGCFGGGGGGKQGVGAGKQGAYHVPAISGSPLRTVVHGESYSFRPEASDTDADRLTFSIANKPKWAYFEPATGRLYGKPHAGHVGTYSGITISVSDGQVSASLPAFDITVNQVAKNSVTLAWTPPTENHDGSALTDLAGYRIYIGHATDAMTTVIVLNNPGLTRYVVENLSTATWYFAMSSVNRHGKESVKSAVVSMELG